MKKIFNCTILVFLCVFFLMGCSFTKGENNSVIISPTNMKLKIKGVWDAEVYKVLEANVLSESDINDIVSNYIEIRDNSISLSGNDIYQIKYTVKIVKPNYTISYENQYKLSNLLGSNVDNVDVYSIIYENKILAEFFYNTEDESYLYYKGVIFKLSLNKDIKISDEDDIIGNESKTTKINDEVSEGVYITLKRPSTIKGISESYRTLWISTKNGELQDIKERKNIIFPRYKGIWYLEPRVYNNSEKNIEYEYFVSAPIDTDINSENDKIIKSIENNIAAGTKVLKNINFVGNDYIATEVLYKNNNGDKADFYKMLPIDNMNMSDGITIDDLYMSKDLYNEGYRQIDNDSKKEIDYSNFTLLRDMGKWGIKGRVNLANKEYIDFPTSLKPIKKLLNYDTLLISWKFLKGINPYIVDAYTSPDKSLAILITKNELLIYKIVNGNILEEPLKRIDLFENEEVIMAEWCSSNYIDRWGSAFKDNSKIIK